MSQSKLSIGAEETEHHHKITLIRTISSFKELYATVKSAKNMLIHQERFRVGGQEWAFRLLQVKEEGVGIAMRFLGSDCVSVEYSVHLKSSSNGEFINTRSSEGWTKYGPEYSIKNVDGAANCRYWYDWKTLTQLQNEGFLSDGSLEFKLVVKVLSSNGHLKMKISSDLKNGLDLDSTVGADVTFVFGKDLEGGIEKIPAHRAILSLRSPVFATMFGIGMKEALEGEVKIDDMTPKAMRILLQYIYSGEVDSEWGSVAEELLYGADKYELNPLKEFLCENIHSVLNAQNVGKIRKLASLYKLPEILKSTMKFNQLRKLKIDLEF